MIELLALPLFLAASGASADDAGEEARVLEPISVTARRVANLQPASTFSTMATELRFDPQVTLQVRGLPEGQADVTVRGGLFENTGFRLGAVTVHDPQTGHYAVEIPLDPSMLTSPELLTDFANAMGSFNASVATVSYGFTPITQGGSLAAGIGTDGLIYGSARYSLASTRDNGAIIGATLSASASRGDGTLPNGDHEFERFSGHLQWRDDGRETNLLLGYHDKFAGWPGMYTGFASLPETDRTKLTLALLDHRWDVADGWWEVGAAWRQLEDDYDFDRRTQESGTPGSFEHETRSASLALAGLHRLAGLDWHINGQLAADRLAYSTDLTHGRFDSRTFGSLGVAPGRDWALDSGALLSLRAGLRVDFSNRDENALAPMFQVGLQRQAGMTIDTYTLEFTRSTQLPGYTALNSRPDGLFGGNPDLGRETADTLRVGFERESSEWLASASVFHRRDDDLVDWTWRPGAPFSRRANPVDVDVTGFEGLLSRRWTQLELIGGYSWLYKDADYGEAEVDASYYALNFAGHRLTLAAIYKPAPAWEFRLDNEYRRHEANALRSSRDAAWLASLSLAWQPPAVQGLNLRIVADNLADDGFQVFPGTPPMGRQVSVGAVYDW